MDNPSGKGLIFIRGGGGVYFNHEQNAAEAQCLAKCGDCVVVNVNFMNAPEVKAPGSSLDCYAALKWLHENAQKYNVDRTRISTIGASGGGFVSAVLAKILAERNESHLVKTVFLDVPQIMDDTVAGPYDNMVEPGNTSGIRAWTS